MIRSIRLLNFRNFPELNLDLGFRNTVLTGNNGHGKTNLLEALYCSCYGASFRTRRDRELIRIGADQLILDARLERDGQEHRVQLQLSGNEKLLLLDGQRLADRDRLIGISPLVLFQHDDIAIITGSPGDRRRFFDQVAVLTDEAYLLHLRNLQRLIRSRNEALRMRDRELTETYEPQIAAVTTAVVTIRESMLPGFARTLSETFGRITGLPDAPELEYSPSLSADPSEARAQLSEARSGDLDQGHTRRGPHRDRYRIRWQGRDFTATASTGQIRLASLILRSAQARYLAEKTGRAPVLLLDDVLLELDPERRTLFLAELPAASQAVFTVLPGEDLEGIPSAERTDLVVHAGTVSDA